MTDAKASHIEGLRSTMFYKYDNNSARSFHIEIGSFGEGETLQRATDLKPNSCQNTNAIAGNPLNLPLSRQRPATITKIISSLRQLDSVLDISKSTLQIDILLALKTDEVMDVGTLAARLGVRRKALTDALWKMRAKGLVEQVHKDENRGEGSRTGRKGGSAGRGRIAYKLTAKGADYLRDLSKLLGGVSVEKMSESAFGSESRSGYENICAPSVNDRVYTFKDSQNNTHPIFTITFDDEMLKLESADKAFREHTISTTFTEGLTTTPHTTTSLAFVVAQVILLLGTSREGGAPLKDLAKTLGLSPQRLQSYLDIFVEREPQFFKKTTCETRLSRMLAKFGIRRRLEPYYFLTEEGYRELYRMPIYMKLKRSAAYKILGTITRTKNPRTMFVRLNCMLYITGMLSALLIALQMIPLIPAAWVAFSTFVGTTVIADKFLSGAL